MKDVLTETWPVIVRGAAIATARGAKRKVNQSPWGGVPLCLSSSEAWGSGFVEGAVAEHGEQDADAVAGEAEEGLGVGLAAGPASVVVGAGGGIVQGRRTRTGTSRV